MHFRLGLSVPLPATNAIKRPLVGTPRVADEGELL